MPKPLRTIVNLLIILVILLVCVKVVPTWYRRAALTACVVRTAQTSLNRGDGELITEMRKRAYRIGFTAAARTPGAFQVRRSKEDGMPMCHITYDFVQPVKFGKLYTWRMRVQGDITRMSGPDLQATLVANDPMREEDMAAKPGED